MTLLTLALLAATPEAQAYVDPKCEGETQKFDDTGQQNFMLNYFALTTTYSPLHRPVPHKPGTGSVGLELSLIPPLSCEQRLVLNSSKTEDTNKSPILPRPRFTFAFDKLGDKVVPYGGFAMLPPVTLFGIRNILLSGELGVGIKTGGSMEWGARVHATVLRTIGEIATPFVETDPTYDDLYLGSTLGLDLMAGYKDLEKVTPYIALGLTDVSTFFYIGDEDYIANNTDPFFGPTASIGADYATGNWTLGGEYYTAPGFTYTSPGLVEDDTTYDGWHFTEGGYLHTVRLRLSYVL
jgi:hypothetical protein